MNLDNHPFKLIQNYTNQMEEEVDLLLSIYKYIPLKKEDKRDNFWINASELNYDFLNGLFNQLEPGFDLSFNSLIKVSGELRQLPLIDFSGELTPDKIQIIGKILPKKYLKKLFIYFSGRSYHGYILHPLSHEEWVKFMGTLLLLNLPDKEPIADQRWIGHRLRAGFSSLRWSYKSKSDQNMLPKFEETFYNFLEKTSV